MKRKGTRALALLLLAGALAVSTPQPAQAGVFSWLAKKVATRLIGKQLPCRWDPGYFRACDVYSY